jgi:hypothetical protein
MKIVITLLSSCLLIMVNAQTQHFMPSFIAIDHVPIVVKDLDNIKRILADTFHFHIKEGKEHEGIKNSFIKFQDGTYLEFTTPIDTFHAIGNYYAAALKRRQGGTQSAVSVANANTLMQFLTLKHVAFEVDSNRIWTTISPKGADVFFIDYLNKNWKDAAINTSHPNTALSLTSIYLLSNNLNSDVNAYKLLGFKQGINGAYLNIPYVQLVIGRSKLYLLDATKSEKLTTTFKVPHLNGICGFEIKVRSLASLNKLLIKTKNTVIEKDKTICFLKDYNIFFVFVQKITANKLL